MLLPEGPPIWRLENFTIKDFPSAIAHQLFLGIGKQLVTYFANRVLKLRGVLHSFGEKVDHILSLIDSLNIHFFRIQNESGSKNNPLSLTGWKCKDIMSFLTLSKWIFSFLIDTTGNDKDNKSKNMPDVNKSKIDFCDDDVENWLLRRGIDTTDMPKSLKKSDKKRLPWFLEKLESPHSLFSHYAIEDILQFAED